MYCIWYVYDRICVYLYMIEYVYNNHHNNSNRRQRQQRHAEVAVHFNATLCKVRNPTTVIGLPNQKTVFMQWLKMVAFKGEDSMNLEGTTIFIRKYSHYSLGLEEVDLK